MKQRVTIHDVSETPLARAKRKVARALGARAKIDKELAKATEKKREQKQ